MTAREFFIRALEAGVEAVVILDSPLDEVDTKGIELVRGLIQRAQSGEDLNFLRSEFSRMCKTDIIPWHFFDDDDSDAMLTESEAIDWAVGLMMEEESNERT